MPGPWCSTKNIVDRPVYLFFFFFFFLHVLRLYTTLWVMTDTAGLANQSRNIEFEVAARS